MDFIDKINGISTRIPKQREHIETEEATKNAFIMPFISALGYDVFNPLEVVPEYVADVGTKKGEKVDYALFREGGLAILFEAKWCGADLDKEHAEQLARYFAFTEARFGVLTNGIIYRFYSDLEKPNKMDSKPFFEFNMLDYSEPQVEELKKFTKPKFDLDDILATASELKYTREIKRVMGQELVEPSEDFVKFFARRVYPGVLTSKVKRRFNAFTKKAAKQLINDLISDRLKTALAQGTVEVEEPQTPELDEEVSKKREINTSQDELEGYFIVKTIAREVVDPKRLAIKDTLSYCGVLFDGNSWKPVCRLLFNRPQKYIELFDDQKKKTKEKIDSLDDIYNYSDQIRAIVKFYASLD